jgi:sulfate adenylyltransferase subunit 2
MEGAMPEHDLHSSTHLKTLEAQSIYVIREVAAELEQPALLFSGGKDSAVMAHLARRAFHPAPIPFPALHVDTGHNFPEVIEFRDRFLKGLGMRLVVVSLPDMIESGRLVDPPGATTRNRLQGQALVDAVGEQGFDALFGGGRRDEEKARAKERVVSLRDAFGQWDPRDQRPELWTLHNMKISNGESLRVFPLSDWTEADIWQYIDDYKVELPDLYYAHERRVFERDGMLLAEGPFLTMTDGEESKERQVRFRTVGDMTCTGAVESAAGSPAEVISELATARLSERGATRADDRFAESAMEDRKREGYF